MSLKSFSFGGSRMLRTATMSLCLSSRSSLISRRMRVASLTFSKTSVIFLIATVLPSVRSVALETTP